MRRWFLIVLLGLFAPGVSGAAPDTVAFCHDSDERPPRFHLDDGEWQGRDIRLIERLFARRSEHYRIDARPWRRCLQSSRSGQQYQAVLSATYSARRARHYLFSDSYYALTPVYLYIAGDGAEPPAFRRTPEGTRPRLCGVSGFDHTEFDFPGRHIDRGARDVPQLINKLAAGRCDIALGRLEIIRALKRRGDLAWPEDLRLHPLRDVPPERYHIMVSRQAPGARALLHEINHVIRQPDSLPRTAP